MKEHFVIVYVKPGARQFTATARKASARLAAVEAWAARNGFTQRIEVAARLSKVTAKTLKEAEIAAYEARRYTYIPRPAD